MQIKLKNIGIVQNSSIQIDGLTVITGKNNSGKTTVGKVLYSLIEATSAINNKYENDRYNFLKNKIEFVAELMDSVGFFYRVSNPDDIGDSFKDSPALSALFEQQYLEEHDSRKLEKYIEKLMVDIRKFNPSVFDLGSASTLMDAYYQNRYKSTIHEAFEKQKEEALRILEQSINDVNKDPELINYSRESISQMLRLEFADQIQPVRNKTSESSILLSDEERNYYSINISGDRVEKNDDPVYYTSPFKRAFFIDNPNIMDNILGNGINVRRKRQEVLNSILNPNRFLLHNDRLALIVGKPNRSSVLEQNILDDQLEEIRSIINKILPGTYEFSSSGSFYIEGGNKLNTANLATGSKMFSIIKILLDKGHINESSLLILDEPEAHLHPEWQNIFAEIVVLLVKKLNTRIVLTSHSPNFVLALDAYMRKYEIEQQTFFYQTVKEEGGMVNYKCVNDDLSVIYQDFMEYLATVKTLRDSYLG